MPIPTTTILQNLGPAFQVTAATVDQVLGLGDTPDAFATGGFSLSFVPDDTWQGTIAIVGRSTVPEAVTQNVEMVPYPFRAFYLNGAVSDLSMQPSGTPITARSDCLVPASGARIGLQITGPIQGSCWVFVQAVRGSTAP